MPYSYKDLTYISAALQSYEGELCKFNEEDCSEDEFSEVQHDLMYLSRLIALTNREIDEWESKGPSLNPIHDPE